MEVILQHILILNKTNSFNILKIGKRLNIRLSICQFENECELSSKVFGCLFGDSSKNIFIPGYRTDYSCLLIFFLSFTQYSIKF